jgi:hypothetical protein
MVLQHYLKTGRSQVKRSGAAGDDESAFAGFQVCRNRLILEFTIKLLAEQD